MKIALLYDAPMSLLEGKLRMDRGYGIRVDALAEHFDHVVVCNTVAEFGIPEASYELHSPNVSFVPLPYFRQVADCPRVVLQCARRIWRASRFWDLLYITLPSPLAIAGYVSARMRGIPVVLAVVGDLEAQYERGRYRGVRGLVARAAVSLFEYATRWMVGHAMTMTQGEALCRKYTRADNRAMNLPWSPVTQEMIVSREDTCLGPRIRLLFVGALLERKGIFVLVETAKLLLKRMDNFVVTYVGAGPLAAELAGRIEDAGLSGYVELKGGVYEESNVWREYDAADIFVFPTYAEGFPRVILEAMARGLPVVSTRVSGIPDLVNNHALLVSPGSPDEVAEAILRVIDDPTLRRNLIRGGTETARKYTLEETTRKRAEVIRSALLPAGRPTVSPSVSVVGPFRR